MVGSAEVSALANIAHHGANALVDLASGKLSVGALEVEFFLQDNHRTKLMNGWDDIDITLRHAKAIDAFRTKRNQTARWAWPAAAD